MDQNQSNDQQSQNRNHGIRVTVVSIGRQHQVTVPAGSTCADALLSAGFQSEGYMATLNGVHTQLHERPDDGDIIALTPKVDGGVVVNQ